jgi:uncharacterized membrane protein
MRWPRWPCLKSRRPDFVWWNVLAIALTLAYPLAIWLGHGSVEPRWLAGMLLLTAATRLPGLQFGAAARWSGAGALVLAALAVASNAALPLKLYPVLVNAAFLAAFASSLVSGPPMIERLARLRQPVLPRAVIRYTRRVTQAWCVFFVANGAACLGTALLSTQAVWSLYTGVVSYLLMGVMFGGEYLVRMRVRGSLMRDPYA